MYIEVFINFHPLLSILAAREHRIKPVSAFLPASPHWGAERRRKISRHNVAAASQIIISRWQTANHFNRAWAYRLSIKKLSPAPGIKLICGPGTQLKRFSHRWNEHLKNRSF
jgi:hypothetical protein